MNGKQPLFLMISRTDTVMGQVIRTVCQYPYNHVSLTLDPSLRQWYSYARYVQDAPFYGGFIRESVERFLAKSADIPVRIFRLDIPESQARDLEQLLGKASPPQRELIYNHFDALASSFGLHLDIPNAHTCLSFACSILGRQYLSIEALSNDLQPCLFFEGNLGELVSDSGSREDPYFARLGLFHGLTLSLKQLTILFARLIRHRFGGYIARRFHRTVH